MNNRPQNEVVDERCLMVPDTEDQYAYRIIDGQYAIPDSEEEEIEEESDEIEEHSPLVQEGIHATVVEEVKATVVDEVSPTVAEGKVEAVDEGVEETVDNTWLADYDHPDNQLVFEMMCDFYPGYRSLWHETKGRKS